MGDMVSVYVERYGGALLLLFVFAVYLLTLAPGITFWDSGELTLGALTLGIPHPPGAPPYCITGKAVSLLPVGSGAFRMNVMSAGFGALCAYMVYVLAARLSGGSAAGKALGLAAGAAFGFTGPAWSVSVVSEVYTMSCLLTLTCALLVMMHHERGGVRFLYAASFLLGMSLALHQSAVFIFPAFLIYLFHGGRVHKRPAALPVMAGFFIMGSSAVLYLALRAYAGPLLNIGHPDTSFGMEWVLKVSENVETLAVLADGLPDLVEKMGAGYVTVSVVMFLALLYVFRKEPVSLFFLIGAALTFAGVSVLTAGATGLIKWGQTEKFYVLGLTLGLPLAASAVYRITAKVFPGNARPAHNAAVLAAAVLAAGWLVLGGFQDMDRSKDRYANTFAMDTLNSVADGAVLVGWGDNGTFPVWYLQGWERYRDDVLFIHGELLSYGWYMDEVKRRVRLGYGVEFEPVAKLTDIRKNVDGLRHRLTGVSRVYLDFSAVYQLGYKWPGFHPQGLVYLDKSDEPFPQAGIWSRIAMPALVASGAGRRFATEGILDIYAFQSYIWGATTCQGGYVDEANRAFALTEMLAPGEFTAECAPGPRLLKTGARFNRGG